MSFIHFTRKNLLILGSLFLVSATVGAAQEGMLTEEDFFAEIPMISSVTNMQQTLSQTPASVTIIDRQTIQASVAVDLIDLFRLVPGFQTYFVNGSRQGVTYHALGDEYPRRLEVKVDGRSVYESLFSAVTWSTIGVELDDVEYIEVVRGANAAADGSNAFLGSINIVTRSPLLDTGLSLSTQTGSAQTRNAALTYTGKIGAIDHRTTLTFKSNDGFDDVLFFDKMIDMDDDSESIGISSRGLWTPTASDNVEFQLGATKSNMGIGETEFSNRGLSYNYQYLNWSHLSEKGNKTQLIVYHNDLSMDDDIKPLKISEVLGVTDDSPFWPLPVPDTTIFDGSNHAESERWDMELRTNSRPADNLRAVSGIAVRHDAVSSQLLFDSLGTLRESSYRAYSNVEWTQSENLIINGGLIVEDRDSTDTYASYRLAANHQSSEDHIWRIALNRSFRAPSLLENNQKGFVRYVNPQECSPDSTSPECNPLFRDIILDAGAISALDVKNEELKSYEIGYAGYFMDRALSLDMRLFYEQMRDVIGEIVDTYPDLDQIVNVRDNNTNLDVGGIEFETVYKPNNRLLVRANYSYSHINGAACVISPAAVGEPCRKMQNMDVHSLGHNLGVHASYIFDGGVSLSSMVSHRAKTKHYRGQTLDGYTRVDLKLAKRWNVNRSSLDVSLTIQNAGDIDGGYYQEYYYYNQFETRYIVGFKLTLP